MVTTPTVCHRMPNHRMLSATVVLSSFITLLLFCSSCRPDTSPLRPNYFSALGAIEGKWRINYLSSDRSLMRIDTITIGISTKLNATTSRIDTMISFYELYSVQSSTRDSIQLSNPNTVGGAPYGATIIFISTDSITSTIHYITYSRDSHGKLVQQFYNNYANGKKI